MGTAHCLGHSGTGQKMGTAGDLCLEGCRYSGDSSAGWLAHESQTCNGHSGALLCGVNNANIAPCGDHRHQDQWGQCFHCTHTLGTCHLASLGPQSVRGHKHHTEALCSLVGSGTQFAGNIHPGDKK